MSAFLLTDKEFRALARAPMWLGRVRSAQPGLHPSPWSGLSLEFADHRPYQPGDDYRLIDWAVYARLRRLTTKVFAREAEAPTYVLLDTSASMAQGAPTKMRAACKIAAAVSFLAHRSQDRFAVHRLHEPEDDHRTPQRGKRALVDTFHSLQSVVPRGSGVLNEALVRWARTSRAAGSCVVISDFLDPSGYREGLSAVVHGRHHLAAVQILADVDLDPPRLGEVRLVDVETRRSRPLVLGRAAWQAYQAALEAWNEGLTRVCHELAVDRFLFPAGFPTVEAALTVLARTPP